MSVTVANDSKTLLNLPSELLDRIIDLVMRTWNASIRAGPTVAKEQIKPGLAAAFEQAMMGASMTHELLIPGTIVLHLRAFPTHGDALRRVCRKLHNHCIEWFNNRESYSSQDDFSGRTIFEDLEAFRLNQNLYYPRKLHRTWRVKFNEGVEESHAGGLTKVKPRKISERHAEWLRGATRILEVRVDQNPRNLWHFESFKQYLPNVEAVVIVFQPTHMSRKDYHSRSDEWWIAQVQRPPPTCFAMGVRTSTRSLVRFTDSNETQPSPDLRASPMPRILHVVSVDHAQQGRIAAEVVVRLSFDTKPKVESDNFDTLSSWQLAQVRELEESSHWKSDRSHLILSGDLFGYSIRMQIQKG